MDIFADQTLYIGIVRYKSEVSLEYCVAIVAVGYRVNSHCAIEFRQILHEYIIKVLQWRIPPLRPLQN